MFKVQQLHKHPSPTSDMDGARLHRRRSNIVSLADEVPDLFAGTSCADWALDICPLGSELRPAVIEE